MSPAPQPLTSVPLGTRATVTEIKLPPASRPRLMEMGLLVGTQVELVRFAPLGDPVEIRVRPPIYTYPAAQPQIAMSPGSLPAGAYAQVDVNARPGVR